MLSDHKACCDSSVLKDNETSSTASTSHRFSLFLTASQ